jgi:hypothetical protein
MAVSSIEQAGRDSFPESCAVDDRIPECRRDGEMSKPADAAGIVRRRKRAVPLTVGGIRRYLACRYNHRKSVLVHGW